MAESVLSPEITDAVKCEVCDQKVPREDAHHCGVNGAYLCPTGDCRNAFCSGPTHATECWT